MTAPWRGEFDTTASAARLEATKLLTDLIEQSPENALLDLRVVDPTKAAGRTILILCNPGDGREISEFNGNPEMAKRVWRQRFREPLIHALEGSLQTVPSKTSPLLTTFQGIALERFTGANAAPPSSVMNSRRFMPEMGPPAQE